MSTPKIIRTATAQDLQWLENGFDPDTIARQAEREIEAARQASPTPSHWKPAAEDRTPQD